MRIFSCAVLKDDWEELVAVDVTLLGLFYDGTHGVLFFESLFVFEVFDMCRIGFGNIELFAAGSRIFMVSLDLGSEEVIWNIDHLFDILKPLVVIRIQSLLIWWHALIPGFQIKKCPNSC